MNETPAKNEKSISWRMYVCGWIAAFTLILLTQFEIPYNYGALIASGIFAFPAALFLCSGYNFLSK